MHTFQCHIDIGSSLVVRALHLMCHLHVVCCLTLYDSPFCSSPSFSSSFPFTRSSPSFSSSMWGGSSGTRTLRTPANEDSGTLAENYPLTRTMTVLCHMHLLQVMSPTGSTSLKSSTLIPQSSTAQTLYHIDDDRDESVPAEIEDEQIWVALLSRRWRTRRLEAKFSNEESLSKRSQSISERTGRPVASQTPKRKSSRSGGWQDKNHFGNAKGSIALGCKIQDPEVRKSNWYCRELHSWIEKQGWIPRHGNQACQWWIRSSQESTRPTPQRTGRTRTSSTRYSNSRSSWIGSIDERSRSTCWWILKEKNDWGSKYYWRSYWKSSRITGWVTQGISKMLNQFAAEHCPTFPVHPRYFFFLLIQEDCWVAL